MSLIVFDLRGRIKTLEMEDYILCNIHVLKALCLVKKIRRGLL